MPSQGPRGPGTGADNAGVGVTAWVNPGNVTAEDGVYTVNSPTVSQSHYLFATNYGFTIPAGATINGVLVEIKRLEDNICGNVSDIVVSLIKGGAVSGNNKAIGGTWPIVLTYQSYGGSSDTWGLTLSSSDVNSSNFGVALSVNPGSGGNNARVDFIRVTITYTPAVASAKTHRVSLMNGSRLSLSSNVSLGGGKSQSLIGQQ